VQTLLDGITVGGRKISDEQQILNLAEAANELLRLVKTGEFRLAKEISDHLQYLIARDEALESGHFRDEGKEQLTPGVGLGAHGRYMPPATESGGENLRIIYARGQRFIQVELDGVFEQALVYFLFAAPQQFYFDGNKRTARYMMNGLLCHMDSMRSASPRPVGRNLTPEWLNSSQPGTGQAWSVFSPLVALKPTGESYPAITAKRPRAYGRNSSGHPRTMLFHDHGQKWPDSDQNCPRS